MVRVEGCPRLSQGMVAADGKFVVLGVAPGECRVQAQRLSDQALGPAITLTVPANGKISIELVGP